MKKLPLAPSVLIASLYLSACSPPPASDQQTTSDLGQVRTYFVAADEVIWDYAPLGFNNITGEPFDEVAQVFTAHGADRIGTKYKKALYREYTDGTFTTLKKRSAKWEHLGALGPMIRATVGDSIRFVFKNNTTHPLSVHAHGVFYDKASEGAPYNDGTSGAATRDDAVPPGHVYTYRWAVPDRAGPGPNDMSSVFWMYHSHTDEVADTYSGLIGPMVITA
jgi:manganese oxidase